MRHFLRDDDLTQAEQAEVLALAAELKRAPYDARPLAGPKSVAMIFDKPTLRTQTSFAAGIAELGGNPMLVEGRLAGIGVRESVEDVARVLGRQVAAIVWRTFEQADLETMAAYAGVPVVNALTDEFHPCQVIADLLTIQEHKAELAGLRVGFVGDGHNNMAHSWLLAGATAGMHVAIGSPADYAPDPDILERAREIAAVTGGSVGYDPDAAAVVRDADVVITDTWVSMGRESEEAAREAIFGAYSLTSELMAQARPDAIALHCLPAYRGKEIAEEVLEGPQSVVWDEAENRRHAQKALLAWLLAKVEE